MTTALPGRLADCPPPPPIVVLLAAPSSGCTALSRPASRACLDMDCAYASAALRRSLHALGASHPLRVTIVVASRMHDWEDDPAATAWLDAPLEEQAQEAAAAAVDGGSLVEGAARVKLALEKVGVPVAVGEVCERAASRELMPVGAGKSLLLCRLPPTCTK